MSAKKSRLILISGAVVLFVLLFISPRRSPDSGASNSKDELARNKVSTPVTKREDMRVYLNLALNSLSPELKQKHNAFLKQNNSDSLILLWDKLKRPDLASYFIEAVAEKLDSAQIWYTAGNRYYYSIPFVKDESETNLLYHRALFCFENCLRKRQCQYRCANNVCCMYG